MPGIATRQPGLEGHWLSGDPVWLPPAVLERTRSKRDRPILAQMLELAQLHGEDIALEDDRRSLSFRGVWRLAAQVARQIQAAPAAPGAVAILLPADVSYFPAILACLAVGRPCVLLDASVPLARNAALIRQTGATVAIVAPGGADAGGDGVALVTVGDCDADDGGALPTLPTDSDLDAPALILCTSGSTGQPKAIVHSERTIMYRALVHLSAFDVPPGALCLAVSPAATIAGVIGLLAFTLSGAVLRFFDLRTQGIAGLFDTMRTRRVQFLRAGPSVLRIIAALPEAPAALASIRNVTTFGEPVLRADIAALRARLPPAATIFAGFGSTESGGMAWYPSGDDAFDPVRTPAGRVCPGIEAIILDDEGHPCGAGEAGELVVRSRFNALGEWRDGACGPGQLTADPADPGLRIHRTGDVAVRSADGVFVVLGRNDRMLKVNGQRVEPSEIEAAIRGAPEVEDCAVLAQARGGGGAVITGYVVLRDGAAIDGVRAFLRTALPAAMAPSRLVAVAALPMLPGGKVDYMALRAFGTDGQR